MSEIQNIRSTQNRDTPDLQNPLRGDLEGRQVENLHKKMYSLEKLINQSPQSQILHKIERIIKEIKNDLLDLRETVKSDQEYKKIAQKVITQIDAFSHKILNENELHPKKIEKIKQDIESIARDLKLSIGPSESFPLKESKTESLFDNYLEALKEVCEYQHSESSKEKTYRDADAYNEYLKALDEAILFT